MATSRTTTFYEFENISALDWIEDHNTRSAYQNVNVWNSQHQNPTAKSDIKFNLEVSTSAETQCLKLTYQQLSLLRLLVLLLELLHTNCICSIPQLHFRDLSKSLCRANKTRVCNFDIWRTHYDIQVIQAQEFEANSQDRHFGKSNFMAWRRSQEIEAYITNSGGKASQNRTERIQTNLRQLIQTALCVWKICEALMPRIPFHRGFLCA